MTDGSGHDGRGKVESGATLITPRLLRSWALPRPSAEADKEERGRVLVVGGAPELPGAILLAGTAALRAGAGKLQIATCASIAQAIGVAVPEARVIGLPQARDGGIAPSATEKIRENVARAQAVLVGPGMPESNGLPRLVEGLIESMGGAALILDAAAMLCARGGRKALHALERPAVLTPHAGEMAALLGVERDEVVAEPEVTARRAAAELRAVIVLKGSTTYIVGPDGEAYCNRSGNVGLATSGSGDTLSGIIAGLAARGGGPIQAAAWGVYLHGSAGDVLAERVGPLGFLARELLAEIPALMLRLSRPAGRPSRSAVAGTARTRRSARSGRDRRRP